MQASSNDLRQAVHGISPARRSTRPERRGTRRRVLRRRLSLIFLAALACALVTAGGAGAQKTTPTELSSETLECMECHASQTAGIYQEWGASKHYRGNVGCWECHRAEAGDAERRRLAQEEFTKRYLD